MTDDDALRRAKQVEQDALKLLRYLSVQEYADLKGISAKTVYRQIHAGRLPVERVTARLFRIRMRARPLSTSHP